MERDLPDRANDTRSTITMCRRADLPKAGVPDAPLDHAVMSGSQKVSPLWRFDIRSVKLAADHIWSSKAVIPVGLR